MNNKGKTKIAFLSPYPPQKCGIANYTFNLEKHLKKSCDIQTIPIENTQKSFLLFKTLDYVKKLKGFNIIHVQYMCDFFGINLFNRLYGLYTPLFYRLCARKNKCRIITTLHEIFDTNITYYGRRIRPFIHLYYKLIYRAIDKYSDTIIIHTDNGKKILSQYFKLSSKYIVIPHPNFVKTEKVENKLCKHALNLPNTKIITFFGYIKKSKGIETAIKWFEKYHKQDSALVIAGGAVSEEGKAYFNYLQNYVKSNGLQSHIKMTGYLPQHLIKYLMKATSLFILPYKENNQSGIIYYPLAYQKPVIASNLGGFTEIAEKYGCILTFKPDNIRDLEKQFQKMQSQKIIDTLKAGIKTYLRDTNPDIICQKHLEIYNKSSHAQKLL